MVAVRGHRNDCSDAVFDMNTTYSFCVRSRITGDWFKAGDVVRLADVAGLTYTIAGAARWRSELPTWDGSDDYLEWPCAPYGDRKSVV